MSPREDAALTVKGTQEYHQEVVLKMREAESDLLDLALAYADARDTYFDGVDMGKRPADFSYHEQEHNHQTPVSYTHLTLPTICSV